MSGKSITGQTDERKSLVLMPSLDEVNKITDSDQVRFCIDFKTLNN